MSNKLILDLTVRLTQALDQNYDVVNMDTVLAVISALEGATITKEQLETTRLAKHINQLRRRNKSNTLAIRAKNLLKKWREMFGITSLVQSEVTSSVTLQAQPTQQQAPKPPISSTSQPASPYTAQLLGENFDNSLSSIGGGVEFSSRAATGSGVSNTGSANFTFNKKSASGAAVEGNGTISSRSNGALTDTQTRLIKSTNRSIINNNSPSLPAVATATKVKHPTSFKNLISGFSVQKQSNSSVLSPILKVPPASSVGETDENNLKSNSTTYIIDDDDNQSQPSTTGVALTGVSSPRTHKSTKRKERDSPMTMAFNIEHSNSPLDFENVSSHETERDSQTARHNNVNQIITSTIDLHDSNSSSNFVNSLGEVADIHTANSSGRIGLASSNSNNSKRIRKDKKRSNERVDLVTESEHFQPTIDETSRIAFPISGIQEYLSLSNSSMSIFPSQQAAGSGGTERYPNNTACNDDNQPLCSSTEVVDGDLTFAGKFKQSNSSSGIEVGSGSNSNYFSNGGENTSVKSGEFPCGNMKTAINNCRDSVSAGGIASATFLPFSRNSNESTSNSRTSQLDLIDVVNQDSQSMITVDDLRQQQQSSNEKIKTQGDGESAPGKYIKETSSSSKQCSKDLTKAASAQKPINAATSEPTTPTLTTNAAASVTSPPVEQKVPKKRGRKKGSKGVDSVLAQSACLSSQFLMSPALGSNKKVKTTMELIADIQNRKLGSATSSPTLMNWFATSRPASSCSEPSLHSPRTSDACSTNATMSNAARSTPEKNISNNSVAADELYESDSDSNTSEPSHDSVKMPMTNDVLTNSQSKPVGNETSSADGASAPTSTIEEQIKELMAQLPPIDAEKIDWDAYEDIPCTCTLREVPPEVDPSTTAAAEEENKTSLGLLENVEDIKIKENYGDEPIISVSVLPLAPEKPKPAKVWSPMAPHSQSAPVSAVTSPVVPSTNQKPMKSIFDLDFDDDNDPLHSFVEAAKTKAQSSSIPENGRVLKAETSSTILTTPTDHSDVVITEEMQESTSQSELIEEPSPVEPPAQQLQETPLEGSDPMMMPPVMNFPTYEVMEDSECEAKQRYEVQTNQITKFHINAFHNCFIPNVNGNWDHSIPQNTDDENRLLEEDSLSENVVPKYGCFINERIPKDLSHVKFTKDFKPKSTKKSDKPPSPFLGVANIHRRQHFRLHHQQRLKRKAALRKNSKQIKVGSSKSEPTTEIKQENIKKELDSVPDPESDLAPNAASHPNIPEPTVPTEAMAVDGDSDIKCMPVKAEKEIQSEEKPSPTPTPTPTPTRTPTPTPTPTIVPEVNLKSTKNPIDDHQQCTTVHKNNLNKHVVPSIAGNMDFKPERKNGTIELDQENVITPEPITDLRKPPLANGNLHHHLTNNNSILHCSDENKSDISGSTKVLHNCNHNILIDGVTEEGIAASRRSSSCSNSSLKQNQNSINMRLRRHRLEQQQLEKQKQLRKRKHLSSFTEIFDFDPDEAHEQNKVPPLLKRIKIVNGDYASARRLTSSITDDDGDSDCYHGHSENDIITEEEIDDDDQVEDEFEDMVDEYDEDDGDDEEDAEEDYGDFHEVVTRDMASTTGNNHIVLTIKKTPSKTNSPSSSSMSPALNVNNKMSSISPTTQSTVDALLLEENAIELSTISPAIQSSVDALLLEDNTIELPTDPNESAYRVTLDKFLELGTVKTVDLIGKTDFFIPETSDVAIYSFEVKKNGDNDHGNDGDDDENERPEEIVQPSNEADRPSETTENAETVEKSEGPEKTEKDTGKKPVVKLANFNKITKSELSESIQLTKKQLRRKELKTHLQQGIREAQKLHRQLFFPYELHPTVGQKILEISSCTSDCTDPSEEETDDDDDDDDSENSNISTSNGTTSSSDGLATGMKLRRRRKVKLRAKRQRAAGGGGGPPSSSSSSSSSSSDSSSSSSSAFTSLSTTSSSSSEDENRKPKKRKPLPPAEKKEQIKEEQSSSSDNKPKEDERELPAQNNFLLRSFNHIYVSTDERRRHEQLKWAAEYRNTQIMNTGYTALTADNPNDDDIPSGSMPEFASTSNSSVYYNSYYNNPNRNIYPGSNNSAGFNSSVYTPGTSFSSYPDGYTRNMQIPTIATPSLLQPSPLHSQAQTQSQSQAQAQAQAQAESSTIVEPASPKEAEASEEQPAVTETSPAESSTVINSARDETTGETSEIKPSTSAGAPTINDSNYRINPDSSIGSNNNNNDNININNNNNNNNNSSVQLDEGSEQDLVAHEEYRTGLRKVDEDVDDEDGNDCARTQQFKEWHEVLQLRSYNDELLTVLPYVVIE